MARIICKFKLDAIKRGLYGSEELHSLEMSPVCSNGNPENSKFWKWTPCGKFEVSTVNKSATDSLELGKEYYIVITDVKPEGV